MASVSVTTPGVSLVSTHVVLTVLVSSGGILTSTSTSKLSTHGVYMGGSYTTGIVLSTPRISMSSISTPGISSIWLSSIPTTGIAMPLPVSGFLSHSSTTPV